jgi:hypothetical protein
MHACVLSFIYITGRQTFYLIDEAESAGKGANAVVSMVHHYLDHFGHGEKDAQLHFDNCAGQNKNNVVLWYALWRVIVGELTVSSTSM